MGSKWLMKNQVGHGRIGQIGRKPPGACPELTEPIDRLTYVLWQAQHAVERKLLQSLADLDLHLTHFGILRHLSLTSGLTGAEIARRHDVTPQSISSAVALLRKRGYVRAAAHPVHRGLVELELTDAGRDVLVKAHARVAAVENQLTGLMSGRDLDTVKKALIRVRDALRKEACAPPQGPPRR